MSVWTFVSEHLVDQVAIEHVGNLQKIEKEHVCNSLKGSKGSTRVSKEH
jgi:hypothetical protein